MSPQSHHIFYSSYVNKIDMPKCDRYFMVDIDISVKNRMIKSKQHNCQNALNTFVYDRE